MRPVILIPGMGGSVLVRKGAEHKRFLHKRLIDNRWINIDVVNRTAKWKRDMEYEFNGAGLIGYDPDIIPFEFGSVKGVTDIVSEFGLLTKGHSRWLDTAYNHTYFGTLCDELVSVGYTDNVNLFGASYDFRLILDPVVMAATFEKFRRLIEGAAAKVPAVVVCHSAGGIVFKLFLTNYVDLEWRQKYIKESIYVNVPFSGLPASVRCVVTGDFYYPALRKHYTELIRRNSAIIMCLPNELAYDKDEVFFMGGGGTGGLGDVSIRNYKALENENKAFKMWRCLNAPLLKDIAIPIKSPSTLIMCNNVLTGGQYNAQSVVSRAEWGDGVVPTRSLLSGIKAFNENSIDLHIMKGTHVGIIRTREFMDIVLAKII